jgi:hypothetical protein
MILDQPLVLFLSKTLLAVWVFVSTAEWWCNRSMFAIDGVLSWRIVGLRPRLTARLVGSGIYSEEVITSVLGSRFLAGLLLLLPLDLSATIAALAIVFGSSVYMFRRAIFGGDGADQMGVVSAAGQLFIGTGLVMADHQVAAAGIAFLAGQATLAYFFAGAAKVVSPIWRSGAAINGVMRTQTYGHPWAECVVKENPRLARFVCWLVFTAEILFPIVFFIPLWMAVPALICYGLFHCVNAYFMGLNSFIFPFFSTYPAVIAASIWVRQILGIT